MKAQRQDNDVRDLVIAARDGDRDALERLLVAHLPYLRRLCLRISGGDEQVTADGVAGSGAGIARPIRVS